MFNLKAFVLLSTALSVTLALTACQDAPTVAESQADGAEKQAVTDKPDNKAIAAEKSLTNLYRQATTTLFQARPLSASAYNLSEEQVGGSFADKLDIYSPAAEQKLRSQLSQLADQIAKQAEQTQADTNAAVVESILRYYAGAEDFPIGYIDMWMGHSPFIINQINGPLIDIPGALQNSHAINSVADAEHYLQRLSQFDTALRAVADKFRSDAAGGWIAPKVLLDKTLPILASYSPDDATQHILYKDFASKLDKLELADKDSQQLLQQAETLIKQHVIPAYQQLTAVVTEHLPSATRESGIWAQPNGSEFYRYAVKQLGDTDLTPEQIHQLGLNEVARITEQMDTILRSEGYTEGTVGQRMTALTNEPRFLYEDSAAGREQVLSDLNSMIEQINQRMPELFATKPPYEVEVRRIPVEIQDSAPGGQYTSPAIDGSKPGIYWINLRDIKANTRFDLKTLTYHEANPGHHWQIALNLAQDQLPLLQRIAPYNSYVEGWALYAELVAYEMGMYSDDPFGNLGRLKAELFRSVRLVVDTGLHAKKWSREQAISYMAETTGTTESDVVAEIERYMAWPGQALGYKMGMIKMLELRDYAKNVLGERFDLKAFHDVVLLGGAMPMQILERRVKTWVTEQQKAS